MKRVLGFLIVFSLVFVQSVFGADQWAEEEILGTRSVSDIDLYMEINNEALGRLMRGYRQGCEVVTSSASQVSVLAGEISIPNSAGTVSKWRRNTSTTTVTWTDIDAGSEATGSYYLYADGDTDQTTFDITVSASSSAPSGGTYYKKIGYFYNDSDLDIVDVGNLGGNVSNVMKVTGATDISTTSTTYVDMTDMVIHFVASGKPVKVSFSAPFTHTTDTSDGFYAIEIDDTTKIVGAHTQLYGDDPGVSTTIIWEEVLTAGTHTIKTIWKTDTGTLSQEGLTNGKRILIVSEN